MTDSTPITLHIRDTSDTTENRPFAVEINPTATIADLKALLTQHFPGSPPVSSQRLIYSGKVLEDTSTIASIMPVADRSVPQVVHLLLSNRNRTQPSSSVPRHQTPPTAAPNYPTQAPAPHIPPNLATQPNLFYNPQHPTPQFLNPTQPTNNNPILPSNLPYPPHTDLAEWAAHIQNMEQAMANTIAAQVRAARIPAPTPQQQPATTTTTPPANPVPRDSDPRNQPQLPQNVQSADAQPNQHRPFQLDHAAIDAVAREVAFQRQQLAFARQVFNAVMMAQQNNPQNANAPDFAMHPPQGMPQNLPQGMPQNLPEGMPQNLPQGMPQNLPQGMPQNLPQGMPQNLPQGMPQNLPQGMPQNLPQGMPQNLPQGMANLPQGIAQNLPQAMAQNLQQALAQNFPQAMAQNQGQARRNGGFVELRRNVRANGVPVPPQQMGNQAPQPGAQWQGPRVRRFVFQFEINWWLGLRLLFVIYLLGHEGSSTRVYTLVGIAMAVYLWQTNWFGFLRRIARTAVPDPSQLVETLFPRQNPQNESREQSGAEGQGAQSEVVIRSPHRFGRIAVFFSYFYTFVYGFICSLLPAWVPQALPNLDGLRNGEGDGNGNGDGDGAGEGEARRGAQADHEHAD